MREKELRLALVCYGGISLAVYMHGITKEVWRLARASRAYAEGGAPGEETEPAYRALFELIEQAGGVRLRVLADIVAGASAGGINGVFLAQAVTTGQSLEPLTELWLEAADVDRLVDPAARAASRLSKLWAKPLLWAFTSRANADWDAGLDPGTRAEVHDKLTRFVRGRWFEPPFGGAIFTRLLLDAFDAMAARPAGPRLLPDEQPLDLFVTVTDFNGHPERLTLNSPPEIVETEHRLTLSFRDDPGGAARLGDEAELVFAARATASFPGAFPPFTVHELDGVLGELGRAWPSRDAFLTRALPRQAAAGAAEGTVLIDGSVLANAPFGPAIAALRSRPARREIDRRFVYLDPKPNRRSVRVGGAGGATPGFFTTVFGALSDIPREQPIRDNLEWIESRTQRVGRVRAVIEALRPEVEASVERMFGGAFFIDRPTPARLSAWRIKAEARALDDARRAHSPYAHLRASALAEGTPPSRDVAYRIRRLRFVSRRLATLAEADSLPTFDRVRDIVYARLAPFLDLEMRDAGDDLTALDAATDAAFADAIAPLPKAHRRAALFAYLGFAFYDVATYALLQGEGHDEFDAIKVDRISPEDAQSLRQGGAEATLKGVQFNSFGAFFSRAYRENDYLWGRLHGAERLIDIVASTLPAGTSFPPGALTAIKAQAFRAILDEEAPRLTGIAPLIATLRAGVSANSGT